MIWSNFIIYTEIQDYVVSGRCLLSDKYNNLDNETPFIEKFISLLPTLENINEGYIQVGKVNFIYASYQDLIFVSCADTTENVIDMFQKISPVLREFYDQFKADLKDYPSDLKKFKPYKQRINEVFFKGAPTTVYKAEITESKEIKPDKVAEVQKPQQFADIAPQDMIQIKIGIVGLQNSGKRSLAHLIFGEKVSEAILKNESQILMKKGRITQKLNAFLITIPLEKLDEQMMLLKDSDVLFIITDSIFQNIVNTQNHLEKIKKIVKPSRIFVIANKQDLPNAVKPDVIAKMVNLPTEGMSTNNFKEYSRIISIIESILEK